MSDIVEFRLPETDLPQNARRYLANLHAETLTWEQLPEGNRERAKLREIVLRAVYEIRASSGERSLRSAIHTLLGRAASGVLEPAVFAAFRALARDDTLSPASIHRWHKGYEQYGLIGLADRHTGRKRVWYGWEPKALALWLSHGQPLPATVAAWLRQGGWDSALAHRVAAFIKALPATLGRHAPQRVGKHFYQQNIRAHKTRDYSKVPVGHTYEGDGHTCDFFVRHPLTGKHYRPELTVWIDWRSRYVAGWMLWDRESGLNTLFSLSRAMLTHDHVPAALHVDPGSGFKARMVTDEVTGFLAKFSITPMFAIAGNARGKGMVEGFFRVFEERCGKRAETYCGCHRTDDGLRRLERQIADKKIYVWSFDQAVAHVRHFMEEDWNRTPKDVLGGLSPAQVWNGLERTPVVTPAAAVVRPRVQRTVAKKWRLSVQNRVFSDAALADYVDHKVIVEFDVTSWDRVWVYGLDGRFICEADQIEKVDALPESFLEDSNLKRALGQIKRREVANEEDLARAGLAKTHVHVLDNIAALEKKTGSTSANVPPAESGSEIELDILNTDY